MDSIPKLAEVLSIVRSVALPLFAACFIALGWPSGWWMGDAAADALDKWKWAIWLLFLLSGAFVAESIGTWLWDERSQRHRKKRKEDRRLELERIAEDLSDDAWEILKRFRRSGTAMDLPEKNVGLLCLLDHKLVRASPRKIDSLQYGVLRRIELTEMGERLRREFGNTL